ncbi:MAG: YdcH family protein [Sterolibacterium sp.]|nr:YdcH family protein [Sterolibacterium sp.]
MLTHQDPEYLRTRLQVLIVEHRDLDDAINRLAENSLKDDMLMQRMKKRKLQLKDRIALLERLLEPNEPA